MARFLITITGPLATSDARLRSFKLGKKRARMPIEFNQPSLPFITRARIFIARKLLGLSASLAEFALWIAPELENKGGDDGKVD